MGACKSRIDYRSAVPEDHAWIVEVVDAWWGRPVARAIPRLFLDHFHRTSFVAEETGRPIAFHRKVGFQVSDPIEGYDRPGAAHVVFTRDLQERSR